MFTEYRKNYLPKKGCDRQQVPENRSLFIERDHINSEYERANHLLNEIKAITNAQRSKIDALRKTRVMNDRIFSSLEQKILKEEGLLMNVLEKICSSDSQINEIAEQFSSINAILERRTDNSSFDNMIAEQRRDFARISVNKQATIQLNEGALTNQIQANPSEKQKTILKKFLMPKHKKDSRPSFGIMEAIKQHKVNQQNQKIALLEQLFTDVKLRSEESDLERLAKTFFAVQGQNEALFQEYQEMEKEVCSQARKTDSIL